MYREIQGCMVLANTIKKRRVFDIHGIKYVYRGGEQNCGSHAPAGPLTDVMLRGNTGHRHKVDGIFGL